MLFCFDADGLFYLTKEYKKNERNEKLLNLIKNRKNIVLTPNKMEFKRLCQSLSIDENSSCKYVSELLGGVTIVQKGEFDSISNGKNVIICKHKGSSRRCGGQGDLLSGSIATFLSWNLFNKEKDDNDILICCLAACSLIKECNKLAFEKKKRGMICSDMIEMIPDVFYNLFDNENITLEYEFN